MNIKKKYCKRCNRVLDISLFGYLKESNDNLSYYCLECNRKRSKVWNENNRQSRKLKYKTFKEDLVNRMGGKCQNCGYDECFGALEFHHVYPTTKKFSFQALYQKKNQDDKIHEELDKCCLLCSNCHRSLFLTWTCTFVKLELGYTVFDARKLF